ncbi:MAG: hypothetical protein ACRDPO_24475 [Streptosporangiaceae bacterium]
MANTTGRAAKILGAATAVSASFLIAGAAAAAAAPAQASTPAARHPAHPRAPQFRVRQILNGMKLRHSYVPVGSSTRKTEPLTSPDDIGVLGHHIFTAFQNGVGPQGEPSSDGNTMSTVVEFTASGHVVRQWDLKGKCDGLTTDTGRHLVIATVNEDAHSSVYTITPGAAAAAQVQHYRYNEPLPSKGGTDAISVYHGRILISASAPGTAGKAAPQPSYPAVYSVTFDRASHVATVRPLFFDESRATVANLGRDHGRVVRLALTDPDSNEIVPASGPRFAGDFMLTSQGDKEQIFVQPGRGRAPRLSVLRLSQSVDDTAWARSPRGRLYGSDTSGDTIDVITGRFPAHSIFVAVTPCDAANAPATCPGPGFPPNYLGSLNPRTGHISRVRPSGPAFEPQGMVFVSPGWVVTPG